MSVALVTGATGLLGSHIVERLIADGWGVRALARDPRASASRLPDSVELAQGDVLDQASLVHAARGVHTIFHAAAHVIVRGGWEAYRVTNIDGTRHIIEAAERSGARLVHLSSVAVYGASTRYDAAERGQKTDEDTELRPLSARAFYARSKRESEQLVLAAHRQGRIWATALRPDVVYGRRDRQFVPRVAPILRRRLVPLLRGGRSTLAVVHAANVADGVVRAATIDAAGGRAYNLANDFDVSVRRFCELAGLGLDRSPIFVSVPMPVARALVKTTRAALRALTRGRFSMVSSSALDFVSRDNPFSSDRARHELGWSPPVRPEEGIPDAFRWWLDTTATRRARRLSRPS